MTKKHLFWISYVFMIVIAVFNTMRETVFWNLYVQNEYQWLYSLVHCVEAKFEIIIVYIVVVCYSVFLCILNSKKTIKLPATFIAVFVQFISLLASLSCFVFNYKASIGW